MEADFALPDIYHQEINHLFAVTIPDLDHKKNPESKEKHLEFYWIHVSEMERHNLQPFHVRTIVKDYIEDNVTGAYF